MKKGPSLLNVRIVWAALMGSQFVYLAMLAFGLFPPPEVPPQPVMLTVLSGVAFINAVMSVMLPRVLVGPALGAARHRDGHLVGQDRSVLLPRAISVGFTGWIVGMAIAESIALFGLVLGVLGFSLLQAAPFFGLAALITLMKFPTESRFLVPFEEAISGRG